MATISLCMISYNEEDTIGVGLQNCIEYVDEIIILDGGPEGYSVDNTKEIALSFPKVKWYEEPWAYDFSKRRNSCVEKATGEMILCKDCDEVFEYDLLANLQRLAVEERFAGFNIFAFATKTYIDGELINIEDPDYHIRYWRNGRGYHYEGELHEKVVGYEAAELLNCNLIIYHYKTEQMQQLDNQLYWDMGQTVNPGWHKKEGRWIYDGNSTAS